MAEISLLPTTIIPTIIGDTPTATLTLSDADPVTTLVVPTSATLAVPDADQTLIPDVPNDPVLTVSDADPALTVLPTSAILTFSDTNPALTVLPDSAVPSSLTAVTEFLLAVQSATCVQTCTSMQNVISSCLSEETLVLSPSEGDDDVLVADWLEGSRDCVCGDGPVRKNEGDVCEQECGGNGEWERVKNGYGAMCAVGRESQGGDGHGDEDGNGNGNGDEDGDGVSEGSKVGMVGFWLLACAGVGAMVMVQAMV